MAASMRSVPCKFCGIHKLCKGTSLSRSYSKETRATWKSVVGLEVHAQISSNSKLFSGSSTKFGGAINDQVSFFDTALPGTLPVLNRRCVEAGVKTALALKSHINKVSKFDRKHYFYADLPAGYQITQQRQPLAVGGEVNFVTFDPKRKQSLKHKARLTQIQLEQDSGKSLHDPEEKQSLIDLNRAGVGLMEVVTEPDFTDGEDAAAFVKELQMILQTLGTCDGKMAEGSLRVDANVSVHKPGEPLGVRSEVKNLNSIRAVAKAIEYEIKRHISELESGREIVNETRSFDVDTGETVAMRDKERLIDYRFMPEPNLPPLHIYTNETLPQGVQSNEVILLDEIQTSLPELPEGKRERIQRDYSLPTSTAVHIVNEEGMLEYFEDVMSADRSRDTKTLANLLINEMLGQLNSASLSFTDNPISAPQCRDLHDMFHIREISMSTLKKVLVELCEGGGVSPREIVEREGWFQITDRDTIYKLCQRAVLDSPKGVKQYKTGKVNKLIGQVQKEVGGRADPQILTEILDELTR